MLGYWWKQAWLRSLPNTADIRLFFHHVFSQKDGQISCHNFYVTLKVFTRVLGKPGRQSSTTEFKAFCGPGTANRCIPTFIQGADLVPYNTPTICSFTHMHVYNEVQCTARTCCYLLERCFAQEIMCSVALVWPSFNGVCWQFCCRGWRGWLGGETLSCPSPSFGE